MTYVSTEACVLLELPRYLKVILMRFSDDKCKFRWIAWLEIVIVALPGLFSYIF